MDEDAATTVRINALRCSRQSAGARRTSTPIHVGDIQTLRQFLRVAPRPVDLEDDLVFGIQDFDAVQKGDDLVGKHVVIPIALFCSRISESASPATPAAACGRPPNNRPAVASTLTYSFKPRLLPDRKSKGQLIMKKRHSFADS